jgi:Lhr-like helicase
LLAVFVYVSFRSHHPDEATMKEVLKELQDNNMDISQLVELKADHCQ